MNHPSISRQEILKAHLGKQATHQEENNSSVEKPTSPNKPKVTQGKIGRAHV